MMAYLIIHTAKKTISFQVVIDLRKQQVINGSPTVIQEIKSAENLQSWS